MFGPKPTVTQIAPSATADVASPPPPTPLPIRDDVAERQAKMKEYAKASKTSGSASTRLSKLGDSAAPDTRQGNNKSPPSAVLGAG